MLQREGSEPLYAQIEELLLQRIRKQYRAGDLIPTQRELAKEAGVSLITVKRALTELGRRGLVQSVRGRGTVVRQSRVDDNHAGISSWTDSIAGLGAEPRTAWTKFRVHVPPARLARLLGLKARQRAVHLERLRLIDGEPICLMTNELPLALVPDLAEKGLDQESLYACLAYRYGLQPASAEEEVVARPATQREQRILRMTTSIVIVIRRQSALNDGRVLDISTLVAPADRYRYRVRLFAPK